MWENGCAVQKSWKVSVKHNKEEKQHTNNAVTAAAAEAVAAPVAATAAAVTLKRASKQASKQIAARQSLLYSMPTIIGTLTAKSANHNTTTPHQLQS